MVLFLAVVAISAINCNNDENNEVGSEHLTVPSTIEPLSVKMTEFINSINTTWRVIKLRHD